MTMDVLYSIQINQSKVGNFRNSIYRRITSKSNCKRWVF